MISREQKITQSLQDLVREALNAKGYAGEYDFVDSFDEVPRELVRPTITSGFDFDDEGRSAEMGSDLMLRLYTVQFLVFAPTETFAKNLASIIKFAIDADGRVPLKDIGVEGQPVIDHLLVAGVSSEKQQVADPEPWQEHIWSATARLEDEYHARLA